MTTPGSSSAAGPLIIDEGSSGLGWDERSISTLQGELQGLLGEDHAVERLLGRGGMSLVFLGRETELNRQIAIKVLPIDVSASNDDIDRFRRESKIAAGLDHPHIVPVHRVGTGPRVLWYTMKFIEGASLADILDETGPLPLDQCRDLLGQVANALEYAHSRGVVHRDVKPANILVATSGWVWICDFGVAKSFGTMPLTQTGVPVGTPGYMSPEQCYGRTLDGAADQYGLAVVAYECLAGERPFRASSFAELVHKQCVAEQPRLEDTRPDLPQRVSDALYRAMDKDPTKRHESVRAFIEALGGTPSSDQPTPALGALVARTQATGATRTRRRYLALLLLLLLLLGVGVGSWWWWSAKTTNPQPIAERPPEPVAPIPTPPEPEPARVRAPARATTPVRQAVTPPSPPTRPDTVVVATEAPDSTRVDIYTEPWGYLAIDGRRIGTTNVPGRFHPSGSFELRVEREGFHPYVRQVELEAGGIFRLTGIRLQEIKP